ncbi:GNAT family N-acetyltransferase [Fusibacter ferrireducens]|uniref:GNAT family N-acetyltransferase n=1 Tax=Fusibacter ferrireducens TaxID=2785058 RepID=A0ABR9ZM92_9FIRM|nr:GNAT family protein [Fusibacter ferrireducens]MBF4691509.1 GNAT family N-acetyltransferase [Fusibacter ferrireducens]
MILIKPIEIEDCTYIVKWNSLKDEDYLTQWAGPSTYSYPLTVEQITNRLNEKNTTIFKILNKDIMTGSIEITDINEVTGYGKVCRYILSDDFIGQGIGQKALKNLVEYSFNELGLSHLELRVYTFNVGAIKCYEKAGFTISQLNENEKDSKWNSYTMTISRE